MSGQREGPLLKACMARDINKGGAKHEMPSRYFLLRPWRLDVEETFAADMLL
jgi:hypothetical protein